ncbi:MAG: short-chain dehydrogenase [Gemmatimonadetes bacterium]|nr:short-chain dehydrogenase [Gemmatimonadota bacterium]
MEIRDRTVLILGGSGLVGLAVARQILEHAPRALVLSALTRTEAEQAAAELGAPGATPGATPVEIEWGDIFYPEALKHLTRGQVMADPGARGLLLDYLFGDLTDDVVSRSALGAILLRRRPEIIVDCVNTATAVAYQDVFASAARLRAEAHDGSISPDSVERHLATLYLPQLIRHVQLALEAMRRGGTQFYIKVGTSGTGGMGLNVPFTHSEDRPSRVLLSKAGVAGAHTLLLYLMARTPGAPAVKEVKPTAAISWKRIAYGEIRRRGRPLERYDAQRPLPLTQAFGADAAAACSPAGGTLHGVFLDAGENGFFSRAEFETLSALGLMEYITPEEIAATIVREIRGHPTGRDVVAALDAATSGPTYRAGVLREVALQRMAELEREHGVDAVAYEMLGPPRLSKLLFEGTILARLFPDLAAAARLNAEETARRAAELLEADADLRIRMLSIGLPVLLPDGAHLLRGPEIKVVPGPAQRADDPRLPERGWVDLRSGNWSKWRQRAAAMLDDLEKLPPPDEGSRADFLPNERSGQLRPGTLAAWVFRHEDQGQRVKR